MGDGWRSDKPEDRSVDLSTASERGGKCVQKVRKNWPTNRAVIGRKISGLGRSVVGFDLTGVRSDLILGSICFLWSEISPQRNPLF